MTEIPDFYNDLDSAYAEAWRLLDDGVTNVRAPFHLPAVATIGTDGAPRVRTVVLRQADRAGPWLQFHTDRRASKVAELQADPRIALHFYDRAAKVQLRVRARADVHGMDAVARGAWDQTRAFSRVCYRIDPGPGTPLNVPDGYAEPEPDDPDVGFETFRVVRAHVQEIEWLYLAGQGHRRARFQLSADGYEASWLTP
ncbi:pyridoxamine 5'-phosphate oxidase family protein [Rhodovibrio salinarum]|uniref:Pyridoxamine 5'-phosphate oxidase n=1 Tax=Rhodovibrio salinarum TaxID=1087 RepID=A0A934QH58_9PROT|nr:pyridoxamine 5'-phosphate oxidase family protein [Rhodovibrio salinarum]MBK1696682.1 pyridoxamine 5'-phosphate oxidase [Rhodovibrio salinarum]